MNPSPIRVYADTSVYGGAFDMEFKAASTAFFSRVRTRSIKLVTSPLVAEEISLSPANVRQLYAQLEPDSELVEITFAVRRLMQSYLDANIVGSQHQRDAQHVALASVSRCSMIVSWNLKHIANFRLIPLYGGVNLINGYYPLSIYTPMEVIGDVR